MSGQIICFVCGVGIRHGDAVMHAAPQGDIPPEDTLAKLAEDLGVTELLAPGQAKSSPAEDGATWEKQIRKQ